MGNARKVLQFSGVVDEEGDWTGDVDFFVQTGDIIDRYALAVLYASVCIPTDVNYRGDDTIILFAWMDRLRAQARAVGGTMLSILGNHEWMNAIGITSPNFYQNALITCL